MFKHLLVPLDSSQFAENALEYALSLAQHYDSQITLLHVVAQEWEAEMRAELPNIEDIAEGTETRSAVTYLSAKEKELKEKGYNVVALVQKGEPVSRTILDTAKSEGADIIVMSSHGFTGLKRLMFGNVAEKVIQHAQIPVLLIRPSEKE